MNLNDLRNLSEGNYDNLSEVKIPAWLWPFQQGENPINPLMNPDQPFDPGNFYPYNPDAPPYPGNPGVDPVHPNFANPPFYWDGEQWVSNPNAPGVQYPQPGWKPGYGRPPQPGVQDPPNGPRPDTPRPGGGRPNPGGGHPGGGGGGGGGGTHPGGRPDPTNPRPSTPGRTIRTIT